MQAEGSHKMKSTKQQKILQAIVFILVFLTLSPCLHSSEGLVPVTTASIMAPLEVTNFSQFHNQLVEARNRGVMAVSVDVWWGRVEAAGDEQYDWLQYHNVFNAIRTVGLKIVPIMSFHRCGLGPGDACDIKLPGWLYAHFSGLSADDLKYESETGRILDDAIAPWATEVPAVLDEFREFMDAFENEFAYIAGDIIELNISLGPTGELRYPSYNQNDNWAGTTDTGNFQAYSDSAVQNFRTWAMTNFGGLTGINTRWGLALTSQSQIRPPDDGSSRKARAFINGKDYEDMQYGRDFIDWYNDSLVEHGRRVLHAAHDAFNGPMAGVPIGMKIPGVHWQIKDCAWRPRIAEITAGLIQTSINHNRRPGAYGYANIMNMINEVKTNTGREVILHFTALEMENDGNCSDDSSMAEALVFWISHGAQDRALTLRGENALAAGIKTDSGWERIENAFRWAPYSGFTLLRINEWNNTAKDRYQDFILHFVTGPDVSVHFAEFETCFGNYMIHTWKGKKGDYPMSYEGFLNGRHWWRGNVPNIPDSFDFTFHNTNGSWEGSPGQYDRTYSRSSHGNEIFVLPKNKSVFTSRP